MTARSVVLAMTAGLALGLSACGFTPLYGENALGGSTVGAELSRIAVQTPDSRLGFSLKTALEDQLGWDRSASPDYTLTTKLEQERLPLGRRIDDTASRFQLTLTVDWVVTPTTGGAPFGDRTTATVTYAAVDQAYGSIAAQTDAEARLTAEAARLIRLDIARRLAGALEP
ncbi:MULTISPECIES: LPS assembly lipoprotein LptE [Brevundimonas]|uniref:LPS assembly lipoprotein LptE n=1 Tax=Brevundimonas TaxID=41275 RepID=UPI001F0BF915|nr:LPS assembly lipoprotein LptE [Brevundimonas lutea]